MSRAWYMNDSPEDQRLEHHQKPPKFVALEDLKSITGVLAFKLNPEALHSDGKLEQLKKDRGYTYEDRIEIAKDTLTDYESKIKSFFTEHLHTDEEIRLIESGSGYFDVRDKEDQWIRIECVPGDLLILPAGIYHRFTLDSKNYIKALRLFVGEPIWTPHNRPAEGFKERKSYTNWMDKGFDGEHIIA